MQQMQSPVHQSACMESETVNLSAEHIGTFDLWYLVGFSPLVLGWILTFGTWLDSHLWYLVGFSPLVLGWILTFGTWLDSHLWYLVGFSPLVLGWILTFGTWLDSHLWYLVGFSPLVLGWILTFGTWLDSHLWYLVGFSPLVLGWILTFGTWLDSDGREASELCDAGECCPVLRISQMFSLGGGAGISFAGSSFLVGVVVFESSFSSDNTSEWFDKSLSLRVRLLVTGGGTENIF